MASFTGYVGMILGLSIILAMIGVQTAPVALFNTFMNVTAQSPTSDFGVNPVRFDSSNNLVLIGLFAIISAIVAAAWYRTAMGGTFGVAETIKTTFFAVLVVSMMADFVGLMIYINQITDFQNITRYIAIVIYAPLAILSVLSGLDWIGGGK
jgi:hypothetical protein